MSEDGPARAGPNFARSGHNQLLPWPNQTKIESLQESGANLIEGFDGELVDCVDGAAAMGDWLGHGI
jgi:hypothetical protein